MSAPDPLSLARHLDHVRRRGAPYRDGVLVMDFDGGWLTMHPQREPGEFPSGTSHRIHWLTAERPLGASAIDAGLAAARSLACRRMFLWIAPWACSADTDLALQAAGADPWPFVEYIAFTRPASPDRPPRPTDLTVREVPTAEAAAVFDAARPWYGDEGARIGTRLINDGVSELHAAFDRDTPVGLALLTLDDGNGSWAYLSAAGTAPAHRARGAQSALICSRITRAAALGARWCSCETNTAVPTSLHNLHRCGFVPAIKWRVYVWNTSIDGHRTH